MLNINTLGFPLFAALLVAVWYRVAPVRRWWVMLGAGVIFYLSIDVPGIAVLAASTAVVWQTALCLQRQPQNRRLWLGVGLAAALGPLLLLKYSGMFADGLRGLWQPLGLAYYSLQLVSYLLDVSRGNLQAEPRYTRLLCFASFFLSIVQGPFNRYSDLMPQLDATSAWDAHRVWRGAMRCAWGYFKKLAIADRAAVVVAAAFANPGKFDTSQLLFALVLSALQLYADFSGYTDIVLGVGEMLGLTLPENFRQPFFAASVQELWERWHISLSRWLRDYVYIPLGGSRKGTVHHDANLLLTFLVSGLWHGANWTYMVWGGLHGAAQVVQAHLPGHGRPRRRLTRIFGMLTTFAIFCLALVVFQSSSLGAAAQYFGAIGANPGTRVFANYWELGLTSRLELLLLLGGVALLFAVDVLHECGAHLRDWVAARPRAVRWVVYQLALYTFLLMGHFLGGGGFMYAVF